MPKRYRLHPFQQLTVCAFAVLALGCVSPKVKYLTNSTDYANGYIKFHLTGSDILLSIVQDTEQGSLTADVMSADSISPSQLGVSVVPTERQDALYAIVPHAQWFGTVRTLLSATFYANTRLIKELGTEVEDNRVQAIQVIGAAAKASIAGFAKRERKEPKTIHVPVVIDPDEAQDQPWKFLPNNPRWIYKLTWGTDDVDAIPSETFFKEFSEDGWWNATSVFPVSACKGAVLHMKFLSLPVIEQRIGTKRFTELQNELKQQFSEQEGETKEDYEQRIGIDAFLWEKTQAQFHDPTDPAKPSLPADLKSDISYTLQLASPDHVRTIRMPDKGTVTTHTICGADTKTAGGNAGTAYDAVSELITQVQAIRDAQK